MTVLDDLRQLEAKGFIQLAQSEPEVEFIFRHALVQEAAYSSLLKSELRALHLSIGETMERLYANNIQRCAPLLADHFDKGGDERQAVKYYTLAGDVALSQFAIQEALEHYTRGLQISQQPQARLYIQRSRVLETLGRFDEALADLAAAREAAQAINDRQCEVEALIELGKTWT